MLFLCSLPAMSTGKRLLSAWASAPRLVYEGVMSAQMPPFGELGAMRPGPDGGVIGARMDLGEFPCAAPTAQLCAFY